MSKELSQMTLEELWKLFPIFLTKPQDCWKNRYQEEETRLKSLLTEAFRISHIGSTAVCSIWAKPIIDILIEMPKGHDLAMTGDLLKKNGYLCMSENGERISLNKGYTEHGFADKVYHLHLRYEGDNDELYFRDYLINFPDIARQYEEMKLSLWKKYEYDRDAYTNAKSDFIIRHTELAKRIYRNRYRTTSVNETERNDFK